MAAVNLPGLSVHYAETGVNLYGICRRLSDGKVRDVEAPAWDTFAVADLDDYDTACAETPAASYFYQPVMPDGVTDAGEYIIHVYRRAGAAPAISDLHVADVFVVWTGTATVNTAELHVDWLNGGRLDLILDAVETPLDQTIIINTTTLHEV